MSLRLDAAGRRHRIAQRAEHAVGRADDMGDRLGADIAGDAVADAVGCDKGGAGIGPLAVLVVAEAQARAPAVLDLDDEVRRVSRRCQAGRGDASRLRSPLPSVPGQLGDQRRRACADRWQAASVAGHQASSALIGNREQRGEIEAVRQRRVLQGRTEARRHRLRRRACRSNPRAPAGASCSVLAGTSPSASSATVRPWSASTMLPSATLISRPGRSSTERQSGNGRASAASQAISVTSTGPSTGGSSKSWPDGSVGKRDARSAAPPSDAPGRRLPPRRWSG